jgi:hyaluronoglucosaminidase
MTHYLYAPKDDPLHRHRWREPYDAGALARFEALVAEGTLSVGFALSPGLSIDYDAPDDRAVLAAKVDQLLAIGVRLICLAVDDIPVRPGLGTDHARLTTWLHEHLAGRADLLLVPTEYTGTASSPYLDALATGVPDEVPIAWTGATVVTDAITVAEAQARAEALGGRTPFVWDNYPVNDAIMGDRLFLGPLRGREPGLGTVCSGFVANPMVQPRASLPALASVAAYLRGDDPVAGWVDAVEDRGWRVFAEACDGEHPRRLVEAVTGRPGDADALATCRAWFEAAADVHAPGLEDEAGPWLAQVRTEANVALTALRLLRRLDPGPDRAPSYEAATEQAMALALLWPACRRSPHTVLGERCSFRPVLGQWPDGAWRYDAASLVEDRNATDRLVRHALAVLGATDRPSGSG